MKKSSREEKLQKKRIAERLRRMQLKNDPVKWENLRIKARMNYERKKQMGNRKLVKDMSFHERKAARMAWNKYSANYRAKKSNTMRDKENTS